MPLPFRQEGDVAELKTVARPPPPQLADAVAPEFFTLVANPETQWFRRQFKVVAAREKRGSVGPYLVRPYPPRCRVVKEPLAPCMEQLLRDVQQGRFGAVATHARVRRP